MCADGLLTGEQTLGIIYSVISRNSTVLAHHASCHGNFSEVACQVLESVPRGGSNRLTYAAGDYMYHYICDSGIIYMCITDDDFERSKAFLFLESIRRKFRQNYGSSAHTAVPYAMNNEFSGELAREMQFYTRTSLNLMNTQGQIQLDSIGIRDLELSGGGNLEQLELLESAESFRSRESYLDVLGHQSSRCYNRCKQHAKGVIILLVILALILVIAVGVVLGICMNSSESCT